VVGIAMVFGIHIPFFGTGIIGGLWLAFIGWFLNNAAQQSYRQVVLEDVLEGVAVETLMRPSTVTVPPDMPLKRLVYDYIMNSDERAFPVLEGDCLVGMVSLVDVRRAPRDQWDVTTVSQVMTPMEKLTVATPREDATQALNDLANRDVRQIPVTQEGRLVGVLRRADIMKYLQLHTEMATQ
jgi:CBS domain-containing protein